MISMLIAQNPDSWHELTLPSVGDSVFVYELSQYSEIISRKDSSFTVSLQNSNTITLTSDDFEICYDYSLPIWATMWSFDDSFDIAWLETDKGIDTMSDCGFRVFQHDNFGYFFGIPEVDNPIAVHGYEFYPALSCDDKKLIKRRRKTPSFSYVDISRKY